MKNMISDENNRDVAKATTKLLLYNVPAFAHPLGEQIISCLLYDRLRESIMSVSLRSLAPHPPPLMKQPWPEQGSRTSPIP